jgi:hypothetical protein
MTATNAGVPGDLMVGEGILGTSLHGIGTGL